ncbi:MAG: succinate dehydrogenase cytochrome b subunit [Chitinophagaceae bacterium]|nr:succinate dehydrogenase cytochrome b subunit [Chitinophagaceae bacterium]
MTWKEYFTSSIGRKLVMAITGISLILFLIVHATVNGMIFFNDHGEMFNFYAHFLSHNYILRLIEIGLFIGFILHIVQGLMLWSQNNSKRPVKYAVNPGNATSKWYSRSMGILGSLLLIFLVIHLSHFWWGTKMALYAHGDAEHNLFEEMKNAFSKEWVVVVYLIGVISLCWHLLHGFSSAFQTLGINSPKYNGMIRNAGFIYSILICLAFAMMPIAMYFGWIA